MSCEARVFLMSLPKFNSLIVKPHISSPCVYHVILNRPQSRNALDDVLWKEVFECFAYLDRLPECKCIVLSGAGKSFCAGIDLTYAMGEISSITSDRDPAGAAINLQRFIKNLQKTFTEIERCRAPVIAVIQNACVGAGVDLITACDVRICTADAWFSVKEVDIGMAADVGTLQRLPKIVGNHSWVRELCFSGRRVSAQEAQSMGLVSQITESKGALLGYLLDCQELVFLTYQLAVAGIKQSLNFSRDHPVNEGLDQIALWNASMLQSLDLMDFARLAQDALEKTTASSLSSKL